MKNVNRIIHKHSHYLIRIQKINTLYEEGHTIVYWIARGTLTNKR